jgi:hypothetical protein
MLCVHAGMDYLGAAVATSTAYGLQLVILLACTLGLNVRAFFPVFLFMGSPYTVTAVHQPNLLPTGAECAKFIPSSILCLVPIIDFVCFTASRMSAMGPQHASLLVPLPQHLLPTRFQDAEVIIRVKALSHRRN